MRIAQNRAISALEIVETGHFALLAEKLELSMGDIATILERAEEKLDRSKAEAFAKKALTGDGFSLEDFRDQNGKYPPIPPFSAESATLGHFARKEWRPFSLSNSSSPCSIQPYTALETLHYAKERIAASLLGLILF